MHRQSNDDTFNQILLKGQDTFCYVFLLPVVIQRFIAQHSISAADYQSCLALLVSSFSIASEEQMNNILTYHPMQVRVLADQFTGNFQLHFITLQNQNQTYRELIQTYR